MATDISPLAPKTYAELPAIKGVRIETVAAGIKYRDRTDLMLMVFDRPASVAGVFTTSKCPSAPVEQCRANLGGGKARALVVNSGNANAFTGKKGRVSTVLTAQAAAAAVGCGEGEVFLASTGVIGEPLEADKFAPVFDRMAGSASKDKWLDAARAIMTTDTYPKLATRTARIDGVAVTLNGIAKGSGMIAPDMATMLSFIVTDADIEPAALQLMLKRHVGSTFNAVTVDSDTSTSDTLMVFATGGSEARPISAAGDPRAREFSKALADLMQDLAIQVVRDGEGASKLVEITVTGAASARAAGRVARSIANSPLVKTAIAGEDANWGRIVMAVGKAGEKAERDRLAIWFGDVRVAADGERDPDYDEARAAEVMKRDEIAIRVDLGVGRGKARVYTCDLTKAYIEINGDYRS
ncbi:bifunctional glutamate N-acetyltransferase/amino-acid acetyltransferase ArgJ [uncultured Hoeflea sp.]|uniref:bifunctional glutamate N-acetyltransferase/amino-acid acetyltransferase ArgJ n=1 Tax=uncultured Hoeflea sp. TaxID=538666 RepID=UPI0026020E5A|nr:bifunctional glutamate N-acetyltransferase/amino-acid acetyltransferase ArgJ [uncultured Hoeflea sp.]